MITKQSTLHEFLLYWNSPEGTPLTSNRTRRLKKNYILRDIIPSIGTVRLIEYKKEHIRILRESLAKKSISQSTQSEIMGIFRQAMFFAQENNFILDAFYDSFYLPRSVDKSIRIYTPSEVDAILNALEGELLGNYYKLIYYTGIKCNEALALHLSDIDMDNNILHIRYCIRGQTSKDIEIYELKDSHHRRDLFLTSPAKVAIHDELQRRKQKEANSRWKETGHDLLFATTTGAPITFCNWRCAKEIVKCLTGIDNFNITSLKYTSAYAAIQAGASDKILQDLFGYPYMISVFRMKRRMQIIEEDLI